MMLLRAYLQYKFRFRWCDRYKDCILLVSVWSSYAIIALIYRPWFEEGTGTMHVIGNAIIDWRLGPLRELRMTNPKRPSELLQAIFIEDKGFSSIPLSLLNWFQMRSYGREANVSMLIMEWPVCMWLWLHPLALSRFWLCNPSSCFFVVFLSIGRDGD